MDQDPAGHHVYSFDQSPSAEAERLRKEARGTPAGVKRDQVLRRARLNGKQGTDAGLADPARPESPDLSASPVRHRATWQ